MTHATPGDAVKALEDLRDAVRNVITLEAAQGTYSAAVLRELTARFDGDLADALDRADNVLDGLIAASEEAALNEEEEE